MCRERHFSSSVRNRLGLNIFGAAALMMGLAGTSWPVHGQTLEGKSSFPAGSGINVTFLDRDGQEIGKRGASAEPRTERGPDYFLDWAASEIKRLMPGKDETTVVARTTLDRGLQSEAEGAVEKSLAEFGGQYKVNQAALVSMETSDGAVRALVGGRDHGASRQNYATEARRQTGSSFSPYVFLTALERGAEPTHIVTDDPVSCGNWSPKAYVARRGPMEISQALVISSNAVAVRLSLADAYGGRTQVLANLRKLGIDGLKSTCSLALGDQGVTLLRHTAGYLHFANGGKSVTPYAIVELRNARGEVVYSHDRDEAPQQQIFDIKVIEKLNGMLQKVVTEGTGKLAKLDFTAVAGKTGTSAEYRDGWFIGYTGLYVTGVWFGNSDFSATEKMTGGKLPSEVWRDYNIAAHTGKTIPPIPGVKALSAPGR